MAGINFAGIHGAIYNAITGRRARYALYPVLGGKGVSGKQCTTGNAAWAAAYEALIAADLITSDFWLCGANVHTADTAQVYELRVADATPTVLFEAVFDFLGAGLSIGLGSTNFMLPYPIYMKAKAAVGGMLGGAGNAKKLYAAVLVATLL